MSYILCIETSTDICSICIAKDGKLVSFRETARTYSHSEVITLFIKQCLEEAKIDISQLNAVAVSAGPGSYTALRIGSTTAKGICYACDIPLISVDTLSALANGIKDQVGPEDVIIPLLDARRKEVYHAVYRYNLNQVKPVAPLILDEYSFKEYKSFNKIHFCGDGVDKAKDIISIKNAIFHNSDASARYMILEAFDKYGKGKVVDTAYFTPFYYKSPNITTQKKNILFSQNK